MTVAYPWPVPDDTAVLEALSGVLGDAERGLPPKIEEAALILVAAIRYNGGHP